MKGQSACPVLLVDGTPVEQCCSGISLVATDQLVSQPRGEKGLHGVWVISEGAHSNAISIGKARSMKMVKSSQQLVKMGNLLYYRSSQAQEDAYHRVLICVAKHGFN